MTSPRSLRVLAADPDASAQAFYREALPALGHQPCVVGTARETADLCRAATPDLVIIDAALSDGLIPAPGAGRPVVLATDDLSLAWAADASAWLAKPLRQESLAIALATAVRHFEQIHAARAEVDQLRQALEERKLIERAKGAVARYCRLDEEEAYRRLRRLATDGGKKLADVARDVLAAAEVFGQLAEAAGQRHANGRTVHGSRLRDGE